MKNWDISSELFVKNREKLKAQINKCSIVIVPSNEQMLRSGDQFYPFRQSSDLFYLTGICQEKTILVMCPDHPEKKFQEALFIVRSNKNLEIWEGHKLTNNEATEISGIENIHYLDEFDSFIQNLTYRFDKIYINLPENLKFKPIQEGAEKKMLDSIQYKYPLHKYKRLSPILRDLRVKKEPGEIELIKKACKITGDAFQRVLKAIKPGLFEYEIEAEISYEFIKRGTDGNAFPPIVAAGKNAVCLHYVENNTQIKDGDLVLLDFGAEVAGYAGDCSRTIPANGRFSPRQLELYKATLRVFKYARSLMRPGTSINECHKQVCTMWQEEHIKLGLYTKKEAQAEKKPLWSKYYMHGTSHFLGLDVHDVGTKEQIFEPGMVLTCEPGIYIEEEGIGIRLENNILITKNGNIDLTNHIPIEPEEIEALIQK